MISSIIDNFVIKCIRYAAGNDAQLSNHRDIIPPIDFSGNPMPRGILSGIIFFN
jgi:hypothetical protein